MLACFKQVPSQRAAVAAVLAAVLPAALPVEVHGLRDLRDALHQRAAQALLGVALLLQVGIVGEHLLVFVDLQLGVQLLQLLLRDQELGHCQEYKHSQDRPTGIERGNTIWDLSYLGLILDTQEEAFSYYGPRL